MASFVPNNRKKIEHLKAQEDCFKRLMQRGATADELLAVAAKVRDARIRVLRSRQNELNPLEEVAFQNLKAKIAATQETTAEEILDEFL
jgi:hypothetical protein